MFLQDVDQTHLIQEITLNDGNTVLNVTDAVEIDSARAADHADHIVALLQ